MTNAEKCFSRLFAGTLGYYLAVATLTSFVMYSDLLVENSSYTAEIEFMDNINQFNVTTRTFQNGDPLGVLTMGLIVPMFAFALGFIGNGIGYIQRPWLKMSLQIVLVIGTMIGTFFAIRDGLFDLSTTRTDPISSVSFGPLHRVETPTGICSNDALEAYYRVDGLDTEVHPSCIKQTWDIPTNVTTTTCCAPVIEWWRDSALDTYIYILSLLFALTFVGVFLTADQETKW